jgi:hypothetical protein
MTFLRKRKDVAEVMALRRSVVGRNTDFSKENPRFGNFLEVESSGKALLVVVTIIFDYNS